MNNFLVAPSILSADFCNLERDIKLIDNADLVHIDVMDYHFVPNLTIGAPVVERIIEVTNSFIKSDIHLMIENPDRWAIDYAKMGANSVTFHYNAASAPIRLAREIRKISNQERTNTKAAIALRPAESVEPLFDILDEFDMILIMTVEPGFGGQKFLANMMPKLTRLRTEVQKLDPSRRPLIQVDGGVSSFTVEEVAKAGANVVVAGSAVYNSENPKKEIDLIRSLGAQCFNKYWG